MFLIFNNQDVKKLNPEIPKQLVDNVPLFKQKLYLFRAQSKAETTKITWPFLALRKRNYEQKECMMTLFFNNFV